MGLLTSNLQGVFSATIDGSTTIEISDEGVVLLGNTVSTLNIGAYPFSPGGDKFLGATCPASAQAQIPWIVKEDCLNGTTHFIPRSGGRASTVNGDVLDPNVVSLDCSPGIISTNIQADASGGPASPVVFSNREDGYNLIYNGGPISIQSGVPQSYTINLGFIGSVEAYLQNFSLTVNPPQPARVQYSFVFAGVIS